LPSGSNVSNTFPATILHIRGGELHQDGLLESGHGVCAQLSALHIRGPQGDFGERAQRDVLHAHSHTAHGHDARGQPGLMDCWPTAISNYLPTNLPICKRY